MRKTTLALVIALVAVLCIAPLSATAGGRHHNGGKHGWGGWHGGKGHSSASKLERAVTVWGIKDHLRAFQSFANASGGTRVDGTPGFEKSVAYVAKKAKKAGLKVSVQPFTFDRFTETAPPVFERTAPTTQTYVEGTEFATMEYSGSGDVTGNLVPTNDILIPAVGGSTSGCEAADFPAATSGNIALIQRGTCPFRLKVDNAAAAGAIGVVIFNEGNDNPNDDRLGVINGTLDPPQASIPAVGTSFAIGQNLYTTAGARVHIAVTATVITTESFNVIADTKWGNPNKTIVVGAHLDSVEDGPGINDNGTGSASQLEIAEQLNRLHIKPKNRIRFAWWGAEEFNLIGSEEYVAGLSPEELAKISLNLNFDMIGSTNFVRFIYDGDGDETGTAGPAGSEQIEAVFQKFFDKRGLATEATAFDGRSDYGPFIDRDIPAGGLFTGAEGIKTPEQAAVYGGTAGLAFDPCYHAACDTIANVSWKVLDQMSDAEAYAIFTYAMAKSPPDPASGHGHKRKTNKGHHHGGFRFR